MWLKGFLGKARNIKLRLFGLSWVSHCCCFNVHVILEVYIKNYFIYEIYDCKEGYKVVPFILTKNVNKVYKKFKVKNF